MFNNEKLHDFEVLKTEELEFFKSNQSIKIDRESLKVEEIDGLKTDRLLLTERGKEEDIIINNNIDYDVKIEENKLPLIKKVVKKMKQALSYNYFDRLTLDQINLIKDQSFFQKKDRSVSNVKIILIKNI